MSYFGSDHLVPEGCVHTQYAQYITSCCLVIPSSEKRENNSGPRWLMHVNQTNQAPMACMLHKDHHKKSTVQMSVRSSVTVSIQIPFSGAVPTHCLAERVYLDAEAFVFTTWSFNYYICSSHNPCLYFWATFHSNWHRRILHRAVFWGSSMCCL